MITCLVWVHVCIDDEVTGRVGSAVAIDVHRVTVLGSDLPCATYDSCHHQIVEHFIGDLHWRSIPFVMLANALTARAHMVQNVPP
jgi:hypothetical protein